MFSNRRNSQKPNDELLAQFKASFPEVGPSSQASQPSQPSRASAAPSQTSMEALDVAMHSRDHFGGDDLKDLDPTPRGSNEQWRFTPSLMDPNSFAFSSFANQPPGYYTPTPGGTNTLYHNQAGDLHTPGFSMGLGTPLSMPTSENAIHVGQQSGAPMHDFHGMAPQVFHNPNPFTMQQHHSFAPHHFTHQPDMFHGMEQHHEESHMDQMHSDVEMHERSPVMSFPHQPQTFETTMRPPPVQQSNENFRFHVTLNAPTAMVKQADEIPVTYLNKGQAYSVSIVDSAPNPTLSGPVKYRTFLRIAFEDEQQRQRPAACWQLWKEGRGSNEAHHRGGRLQAVEFVDPSQVGIGDTSGRPSMELDSASFDGFSIVWSPASSSSAECSIPVRFNFLSTDFSHSKGVKGIPVRLTAKTEIYNPQQAPAPQSPGSEICYCKVKLFRDHGAERKLSNDIAHVKKSIDKMKQQIAQAESGMKDFGKRKRTSSISKQSSNSRPGKAPKHKRTWSMSSASSSSNRQPEEDLHLKLATLQDMFTSTRPASVLYLRGDELDDPDMHPVHLTGEPQDLTKIETGDATMWERQSNTGPTSSIVSPTLSVDSLHSGSQEALRRSSGFTQPTPFGPHSRVSSNEWRSMPQTATSDLQPTAPLGAVAEGPVKVPKTGSSGEQASLSGWIEALGVDFSYQPPPERAVKPVACFYVQSRPAGKTQSDNYYRAVYLMQRTLKDLVNGIASKCEIEPTSVMRTLRVTQKGLSIILDDETVREIPEGQDMVVEIVDLQPHSPMKREWDAGPTDVQVDGDMAIIANVHTEGHELRLLF
ncbi:hypothetical protein K402DRAFT_423116 [Aulographum hederae CBS 113979]|uniref:Grh/CP2 DB domain-containing protein n=1 Tax=Aulographum hederae CBS 113979 TaxID=1176131 RepID=A0A6G1GTA2_9PEZI|nr:hypothetical protein K402DRAFT_423116 [Aulographum hederae CBS 113979]